MDQLIPAMARALAELSAGAVVQPVRTMLAVPGETGFFAVMPAYAGGALGAKLVTFYPDNTGIPTHHALILLFDPETGEPLVTMDGRLITEMRTGRGVRGRDRTARADGRRGPRDPRLGRAGAEPPRGAPARPPVPRGARVEPATAPRFAERHGVHAAASAEEAVRGADVVVVATSSRTPVLRGAWLSPGAHVNAVGAARPDWRELDDDVVAPLAALRRVARSGEREAGDVIAAGAPFAEIGEVVAGTRPGRGNAEEMTLFKSVGVAVADVAAARLVYQAALREGESF